MRKNHQFVFFRTPQEKDCEILTQGIISEDEWATQESFQRIYEDSWELRYKYEASLLTNIIQNNNCKKILIIKNF